MKGIDRAALYLVAAGTGYRRSELRSLTPECFDLGADSPTVAVEAAHSKAGRRHPAYPKRSGSLPTALAGQEGEGEISL